MISFIGDLKRSLHADTRFVDVTGKEKTTPGKDGDISFHVECPYCHSECVVHFSLTGRGNFLCRTCGSLGPAHHGEYQGKRYFELVAEGEVSPSEGSEDFQ